MIRIIATIHNAEIAVNAGGNLESISEIIEIPSKSIPPNLEKHLKDRKNAAVTKSLFYQTLSLSLLKED